MINDSTFVPFDEDEDKDLMEEVKTDGYFYVWDKGKMHKYKIASPIVNNDSDFCPCYSFNIYDEKDKIKHITYKPNSFEDRERFVDTVEWHQIRQKCSSLEIDRMKEFLTNTYKKYIQDKEYIIAQENALVRKYKNFIKGINIC